MARKRKVVHRKKRTRRMRGRGFFGRIWEGIKTAVRKPSTWLTGASMIPGNPLSIPLKVAGTLSGLAGHGRKRKRKTRHRGSGLLRAGSAMGYVPRYSMPLYMRGSGLITEPIA